jgi:hypothetical protein
MDEAIEFRRQIHYRDQKGLDTMLFEHHKHDCASIRGSFHRRQTKNQLSQVSSWSHQVADDERRIDFLL